MIEVRGSSTFIGTNRRPVQTFTVVTGVDELDAMFHELARDGQNRAVRTAMAKMLRVIARGIKAAVPPVKTPGHLRSSVTNAIFQKFKRNSFSGVVEAKVGAGVGRKINAVLKRRGKRRGGVGMSARNIHWYILGTADRWTGRQSKHHYRRGKKYAVSSMSTGKKRAFRGRMPAQGIVKLGLARSSAEAEQTYLTSFRELLNAEIAKVRQSP